MKTIPLIGIAGTALTDYSISQVLSNGKIQAETLRKVYDKFHPDGIFTMMDLTVETEALGLAINFPQDNVPTVATHPINDKESLDHLRRNYQKMSARMPVFVEATHQMREIIPTTIGAYVIGPFTLAGELTGVENLLTITMTQPDFLKHLLDFSITVISDYAEELYQAGADQLCVLEPTAMMLSPDQFIQFSQFPFKEILTNISCNDVLLHICGNTTHLLEGMMKSGATGLSLDATVNFPTIINKIPPTVNLIGNLDPVRVFLQGNEAAVYRETKNLIKAMRGHNNFILSSGCDLPKETPLKNISAFMKAAKEQ